MATTLVISPTTNTMLKTALYSGYLNTSFLMHVELFAELFSDDGVVYILKDEEWSDERCLLCIDIKRKGCTVHWIQHIRRVKHNSLKTGCTERHSSVIQAIAMKVCLSM